MLQGNELFRAQEDEGDQVRRERRQPEAEFVRSVIRYVTIWRSQVTGHTWVGRVLHDTYEAATIVGGDESGSLEVAAVRLVRIDL